MKKKWQDIQSAAKKREVSRLKTQRLTGGGPPPSDIKDWEKKVLSFNLHNLSFIVIIESGWTNFIQNKICLLIAIKDYI